MNNENEVVVPETTEDVTPEVTTDDTTVVEESVDEVKAKLAKTEELANNYKIRAEKAEKKLKEPKEIKDVEKKSSDNSLSTKDLYALTFSKVAEEDIDEVLDYAKFKKISVSEALKTSTVKNLLKEKEEQRNIANATNTNTTRRSNAKLSDEAVIEKAKKGNIPQTDEEISRLAEANMALLKQRRK